MKSITSIVGAIILSLMLPAMGSANWTAWTAWGGNVSGQQLCLQQRFVSGVIISQTIGHVLSNPLNKVRVNFSSILPGRAQARAWCPRILNYRTATAGNTDDLNGFVGDCEILDPGNGENDVLYCTNLSPYGCREAYGTDSVQCRNKAWYP